ncbi:MAG: TauD/TfdA dioxygenase family protein [Pseudomonadales bacterium]
MAIQIAQLTPVIGAEVSGVDLAEPKPGDVETVREALTEHQVLFFRDQPALAPAAQVAFARAFGPLHTHPAAPQMEGQPEIFVIHAHRESRVANGNGWHTDVSCDERPPMATLLQLHVLPATGGDTLFSSMYAAFESLSADLRGFLATLTATHASEHVYRGRYADRGVDDANRTYPSAVHPVVRTHPWSGRQALYVNPSFTTRINELTADESQALLDYLYRHQQRPEFQVRFRWSPNAVAFWDNRCTQHFALWDYWPEERKGHRVTIEGERPYYDADSRPRQAPKPITKLARRL